MEFHIIYPNEDEENREREARSSSNLLIFIRRLIPRFFSRRVSSSYPEILEEIRKKHSIPRIYRVYINKPYVAWVSAVPCSPDTRLYTRSNQVTCKRWVRAAVAPGWFPANMEFWWSAGYSRLLLSIPPSVEEDRWQISKEWKIKIKEIKRIKGKRKER